MATDGSFPGRDSREAFSPDLLFFFFKQTLLWVFFFLMYAQSFYLKGRARETVGMCEVEVG